MTVYVNGISSQQFSGEVTITSTNQTGVIAHGLGYTPDPALIDVKPKDGTDPGGDTITITTDGANITVNCVSGPFGENWIFEVDYKLVR